MPKKRLDEAALAAGLAPTKAKVQALVLAGEVLVNGMPGLKAGQLVPAEAQLELRSKGPKYVSRGGIKLAGALEHFGFDVRSFVCLDIGASTGGFTDCLLQRGAKHVFTIDVGKGQLDPKIRNDSRVTWRESFHVKQLTPDLLPQPVDLAVIDVSFISLRKVLPFVLPCVRAGGWLLALVKPQFEGTRKDVAGTGVVKSELRRQELVRGLARFTERELKLKNPRTRDAVLEGPRGNRESFLLARL